MATAATWIASDTFLAIFLGGSIIALCAYVLPMLDWGTLMYLTRGRPSRRYGIFSLKAAVHAYARYPALAGRDIGAMRRAFGRINRTHARLATYIGYPTKLDELERVTRSNGVLTRAILENAASELSVDITSFDSSADSPGGLGRTRESLRHLVRDWSTEGAGERARVFEPIISALKEISPEMRESMRVLVPGAGLGRLAWEISTLGFDVTAVELSYHMTLALRLLLSPTHTPSPKMHVVHPYAHWFSHQRRIAPLFRGVNVPDVLPRQTDNFRLLEADFLSLPVPRPAITTIDIGDTRVSPNSSYAFIVTLFFIDTSLNIIETLEQIYRLLVPGGVWINLGPLLWTGGAQASLELSLEEIVTLAERIGFTFDPVGDDYSNGIEGSFAGKARQIECEYTADTEAMMRWIYRAQFWIARKSDNI